jgi:hypothetical protein
VLSALRSPLLALVAVSAPATGGCVLAMLLLLLVVSPLLLPGAAAIPPVPSRSLALLALVQSMEKITLNLSSMKFMLYGDAENEPKEADQNKLVEEVSVRQKRSMALCTAQSEAFAVLPRRLFFAFLLTSIPLPCSLSVSCSVRSSTLTCCWI